MGPVIGSVVAGYVVILVGVFVLMTLAWMVLGATVRLGWGAR